MEHVRAFRVPAGEGDPAEGQVATSAEESVALDDLGPVAAASLPTPAPGDVASPGPAIRGTDASVGEAERLGCTAPQLRRFIKSRAYVPMHELRRRFAIIGMDDDVTPIDLNPSGRVFVGLPTREGRLLGELLRAGDVGYELSLDPISPIVVGVFPMRPVPRA